MKSTQSLPPRRSSSTLPAGTVPSSVREPLSSRDSVGPVAQSFHCRDAADANDDGEVDLSDAVAILEFLFLGARIIDAPGTSVPGEDPTEDALDCAE